MRFIPWYTDDAVRQISLEINEIKNLTGKRPFVFEFGAGASTLYYLMKGCVVYSVESDSNYAEKVIAIAEVLGVAHRLTLCLAEERYAEYYQPTDDRPIDIVAIDGDDRVACINSVFDSYFLPRIILIDNANRRTVAPAVSQFGKNYVLTEYKQTFNTELGLTTPDILGNSLREPWSTVIAKLRSGET